MSSEFVIETENVARSFGRIRAVDRLSLRVPRGVVYGFLGPNGAGKTTTIRMLLGLIRPHGGLVRLFGAEMKKKRGRLLGRVGALVESPSFYAHLTGRENLEVTRRLLGLDSESVSRSLEMVRLAQAADRKAGQYSTGMRQRLGLAQAFLARPELIVLDEPTNGLDPAGIQEVRELIRDLPQKSGVTVFLSSHLLNEVEQVAGRIGIIQAGRLRFEGALEELQAKKQNRVVVGVNRPEAAASALREIGSRVLSVTGQHLTLAAGDEDSAVRINDALVRKGFKVFHLRLVRPNLEEIFLSLTGDDEREKEGEGDR